MIAPRTRANTFSSAQSPIEGLSERLSSVFSQYTPIDIDVWNATLKPASATRSADGREPSQNQNQTFAAGLAPNSSSDLQPSNLSPRLYPPGSTLADSKTHNRQTSIVHGIQHSRNGSLASSSSSPLSPQIIAAAGGGRSNASNMGDSVFMSAMSSNMSNGGSFSSSTTLVPDRPPTENSNYSMTQRRVERMHSGRSRRDHSRHHSNSRHHKEEVKTVGEYALHVLFTSVSCSTCTPLQAP